MRSALVLVTFTAAVLAVSSAPTATGALLGLGFVGAAVIGTTTIVTTHLSKPRERAGSR